MEKPVVVLVGDWEYADGGGWEFVLEKRCMAQCIMVDERITYKNFKSLIERQFAGEVEGYVGRMAYWLPTNMSIFSTAVSPPVSITSDVGVRTFMKVTEGRNGLNLFVTFAVDRVTQVDKDETLPGRNAIQIISLDDGTPELEQAEDEREVRIAGDRGEKNGENARQRKGKEIVVMESIWGDGTWTSDADDSDDCCPYATREEEEYNYDYWNALNSRESERLNDRGQSEEGGPSNRGQIASVPETQGESMGYKMKGKTLSIEGGIEIVSINDTDAGKGGETLKQKVSMIEEQGRLNERNGIWDAGGPSQWQGHVYSTEIEEEQRRDKGKGKAAITEAPNGQGEGDIIMVDSNTVSDVEEEYEIQEKLATMYKEIYESDIFATEDCPPCFGDEFFERQDLQYGEYDPKNDAIYIGRVFRNKQDMRTALAVYAVKRFFNFRQVKSDKERLVVACVDRSCPWRVYGHVVGGTSENLSIRTATLTHTCDVSTRSGYGKKATSKVIAEVLRSKYANGKIGPRAIDVPAIVLEELSVSISYMRGWHAKEVAVAEARGSWEQSYKLLLGYLNRLKEKNEGTVTVVETSTGGGGQKKFKYLFFALGASIHGLPYMRKVIIIDGTQIKGKFKGCLLTASCQDGNFCIFPIAFGVVNSENEAAWSWFFTELKAIIPDSEHLVFVSDRHASIYKALQAVYPRAGHGACAVHLFRNVLTKFSRAIGVPYLVSQAATAFTVPKFTEIFTEIEKRSPACAQYLRGIGISHWARAYFQGKRYNMTNTNIAESLNGAVAKALEFPIVTMVETIRLMLMRWFYERREQASTYQGRITPEVEKKLLQNLQASGCLFVVPATTTIFQVSTPDGIKFSVDLERRSCTCKEFDTLGYPCCHGMAAVRETGCPVHMFVDEYYKTDFWRNAYRGIVMPVPDEPEAEVPREAENSALLPPETSQPPGRPRKRRIPSSGETSGYKKGRAGANRCSRCFEKGHNRATCKNPLP